MNSKKLNIMIAGSGKYLTGLIKEEIKSAIRNVEVTAVSDFDAAITELERQRFDFIIVDIDYENDLNRFSDIRSNANNAPILIITENSLFDLSFGECLTLEKNSSFHKEIVRLIRDNLKSKLYEYRLATKQPQKDPLPTENNLIKITTGTLSHQINNPLMTILGMAELILEENGSKNSDLNNRIKIIHHSARQIQRSLKDLSEISEPNIRQTVSGPMLITERTLEFSKKD